MGKPITVTAQIEIHAPPAAVRSVFLDFSRYREWAQGWEINPNNSEQSKFNLNVGDRLKVSIYGLSFRPYIKENSAECFSWEASLPGLSGKRHFYFHPSTVNPGGTTFIQAEHFTGAMTHMLGPWSRKKPEMIFWDVFNAALKMEVERSGMQIPELGDTTTTEIGETSSPAMYMAELGDTSPTSKLAELS